MVPLLTKTCRAEALDGLRRAKQYRKDLHVHSGLRAAQVLAWLSTPSGVASKRKRHPYDLIGSDKPGHASPSEDTPTVESELYDLLKKIGRAAVTYSDLPQAVRDNVQAVLRDPERLGQDVELELKRCLDSRSSSDFIRAPGTDHELGITLRVGEEGRGSVELPHEHVGRRDDSNR